MPTGKQLFMYMVIAMLLAGCGPAAVPLSTTGLARSGTPTAIAAMPNTQEAVQATPSSTMLPAETSEPAIATPTSTATQQPTVAPPTSEPTKVAPSPAPTLVASPSPTPKPNPSPPPTASATDALVPTATKARLPTATTVATRPITVPTNPVIFEIVSEVPGYSIDPKSINNARIQVVLDRLGLWPLVNVPLLSLPQSQGISPDIVTVKFLPLSPTGTDNHQALIETNKGATVIAFVAPEFDVGRNQVRITIFVNPKEFVKTRTINTDELILSAAAMRGMFFSFQKPPLASALGGKNPVQIFYEKAGDSILNPVFRLATQ